jgi:titin
MRLMIKTTESTGFRGSSRWALVGATALVAAVSGVGVGALPASAAGGAASSLTPMAGATGTTPQTITFAQPADTPLAAGTLDISATTDSPLAVTFTSATPAVCDIVVPLTGAVHAAATAATVELKTGGTCTINADQDGDATYAAAPRVTKSFAVTPTAQTITFAKPADTPLPAGTVNISATASSGLPVIFSSATPAVCTVPGAAAATVAPSEAVTLKSAGTCTINADQGGNSSYAAATRVTRSFAVTAPTTPDPSAEVTATAGVSSITVTWHAPAVDGVTITGYTAVANPGPATCTTTGATTCVLGATAGVKYTVTVIAHTDGDGDLESDPSNEVTPTAPPVLSEPPATDLTLTTDKGAITTANPGQEIVFVGTGFAPHSTVTITMYSTPTVLGSVVTDANGDFRRAITVPATLAAGAHTAVAQGVAPDGTTRAMRLSITVAPRASALPVTGAALTTLVLVAVSLTVVGVALTRIGRRRAVDAAI